MKLSLYNLGWSLITLAMTIGVTMICIAHTDAPNITVLQYMLGIVFVTFWVGIALVIAFDESPSERHMRRVLSTRHRPTALAKRDIRRLRGKATRFDNWRNDREFKRIQKGLMSTYV